MPKTTHETIANSQLLEGRIPNNLLAEQSELSLLQLKHNFFAAKAIGRFLQVSNLPNFFVPTIKERRDDGEKNKKEFIDIIEFFCFVLSNKYIPIELIVSREAAVIISESYRSLLVNLDSDSAAAKTIESFLCYVDVLSRILTEEAMESEMRKYMRSSSEIAKEQSLIHSAKRVLTLFARKLQFDDEGKYQFLERMEENKRRVLSPLEDQGLLIADDFLEKRETEFWLEAISIIILSKLRKLSELQADDNNPLLIIGKYFQEVLSALDIEAPILMYEAQEWEEISGRKNRYSRVPAIIPPKMEKETVLSLFKISALEVTDLTHLSLACYFNYIQATQRRFVVQPGEAESTVQLNIEGQDVEKLRILLETELCSLVAIISREFLFINLLDLFDCVHVLAEFSLYSGKELPYLPSFFKYIKKIYGLTEKISLKPQVKNADPNLVKKEFLAFRKIPRSLEKTEIILQKLRKN